MHTHATKQPNHCNTFMITHGGGQLDAQADGLCLGLIRALLGL